MCVWCRWRILIPFNYNMTNPKLLAKLAKQELTVRETVKPVNVLAECLPYQLEFINDPAKYKAVCGTRRAAKSFMFALYLINQAITVPNSKCVYMGLTNESCKQIMWSDILEVIFDKYHIEAKCNSKYEIEFTNGSVIFLRGLDATPHQMQRLRGNKFDISILDEVQDFTQDVEQIIDGVLKMALAQTGATICIGGTPSDNMGLHYWWRVNDPNTKLTQWKLFHFNWKNNTTIEPKTGKRVCDAIQEVINADILRNPLIIETPRFKQEVLGQWVIDSDAKVYKFNSQRNIILPSYLTPRFMAGAKFILGMDLGYYDATAFVIAAYNKYFSDTLYILKSFKKSKLNITEVAKEVRLLRKEFKFSQIIVDAANAQAVEEMRQIHNLPLEAADKLGKEAHIALLNSDFITANIKIVEEENEDLLKELETLIWNKKALLQGKHVEDGSKDNHLTDALLYAHHNSRHYWYQSKPEPIEPEENMIQMIEKQTGFNKPKPKYLQVPWYQREED